MLILQNSIKVFVIFSIVCVLAYIFSFHMLFLHTAYEVFYYGALFFASYVVGTTMFQMLSKMVTRQPAII